MNKLLYIEWIDRRSWPFLRIVGTERSVAVRYERDELENFRYRVWVTDLRRMADVRGPYSYRRADDILGLLSGEGLLDYA